MRSVWLLVAIFACCALAPGRVRAQSPAPGVLPPPGTADYGPNVVAEPLFLAPAAPGESASMAPSVGDFESLLPPLSEPLPAAAPLEEQLAADSLAATITPTPEWYHPNYWLGEGPWSAGIELGINGSDGNNNTFSMRAGGHLKRETKRWKFDSSLVYNRNISNSVETQNNGKLDARLDRNIADSRWTLFVLENMIYDRFQAYDLQLSLNSGVGYHWVKTPTLDLLSRLGAGAVREFGTVDDQWEPNALMGLDYDHKISKMQHATAKIDYFPEWGDFSHYRVVSDLGWQIDLDRPKNVSIKLSVIDRYDSTPNGAVPNNLDYAVLLIWGI